MKLLAFCVFLLLQTSLPQFTEVVENTFDGYAQYLCAADFDSDGTAEILVWDGETSEVICYSLEGSPLWTLECDHPVVTAAAEDLDDDGFKEIFLAEDLGGDVYYSYRIIRLESDGTASWRKYMEISVQAELEFHFVNADGNPGKEVVIANRVLLGRGLERLSFEWNQIILGAEEFGGTCYFLVHNPEESLYELYNFDKEVVWQGHHCDTKDTDIKASIEVLLCDLFIKAGTCSCLEDWTFESVPFMKSVRLWRDITGDGTEEAVYATDTTVQLIDSQGSTLWTWECPSLIEDLIVLDISGDTRSEIIVLTPQKPRVPSLYILDCTGTVQSVYALNLSGTPTVVFSDLDGDGDSDLLTFDQKKRGSTLKIYGNTLKKGFLDRLTPVNSLAPVNPSSMTTRFWTFYASYTVPVLVGLALVIVVAGVVFWSKRKKDSGEKSS